MGGNYPKWINRCGNIKRLKGDEIMTENLQIELLRQQLNSIISNSKLSMGVIEMVLYQLSKEYSAIYSRQLEKEYKEYQESLNIQEEKSEE